jgi:hypothetical protein
MTVKFGSSECVIVPYVNGYRGEFDPGVLEVTCDHSGYPSVLMIDAGNTSSRCPSRPSQQHPERRAMIVLTKKDALKFREALDAAIATLPDEGFYP